MKDWFSKLKGGLSKTSTNLGTNLKKAFALNKPNKEILKALLSCLSESMLASVIFVVILLFISYYGNSLITILTPLAGAVPKVKVVPETV